MRLVLCLSLCFCLALFDTSFAQENYKADVVVYGASGAGVMAAVAAGREGSDVLLIAQRQNIGGMVTGGLSSTDYGDKRVIGGLSRKFYDKVGEYYDTHTYYWRGPEPHVAEEIMKEMLKEAGVQTIYNRRVDKVIKKDKVIQKITLLEDGSEVEAKVFVDAGYEGDLMARSGVSYTIGREGRDEYNESLAGRQPISFTGHQMNVRISPFKRDSVLYGAVGGGEVPRIQEKNRQINELIPLINPAPLVDIGEGDNQVQGYGFRIIVTDQQDNMLKWPKPDNYNPDMFELVRRYYDANPDGGPLINYWVSSANSKADVNSIGPISLNMVDGTNAAYPDANYAKRDSIWQRFEDYTLGLAYFTANDPSVPQHVRDFMSSIGLAKDEFKNHEHNLPHQLYIRVGRRMKGEYFMTQYDLQEDTLKYDSIGMGSYNIDLREHQRTYLPMTRFPNIEYEVYHEGYLSEPVPPYEIPYRSLVPKYDIVRNLINPTTLSASSVAYASIRMEPNYMLLGHSAGVAAAMTASSGTAVQKVDIQTLQYKLRDQGQVLSLADNPYGALNPTEDDIIIDNSMTEFVRMSGEWNSRGEMNRYRLNHRVSPKGESGIFQFNPYLYKSGNYELYTWYPTSDEASDAVTVKIYKDKSIETISIDQQENGGEWVRLGTFSFSERSSRIEFISDGNLVSVDAVKFKFVD